jgi:amino acid transporter
VKISDSSGAPKKLGTFGGVFTPSLLTILGVIMYLRFGWVVGNVGLVGTLIIVTLSTSITFLTSLSIAAIATNAPVKAGGAYYMISRSLGVEIGGAVGIPLFLAQAFSVALYVIGFSESLVAIFPSLNMKMVGIVTTLLLGSLAFFSTKAAIKAQYFILGIIALSLLSLFFGDAIDVVDTTKVWSAPTEGKESFWKVFAVFFPAVTGIMAGVNLSGDLKDPAKSIPKGTFLAVGVGYLVYMILPIFLAYSASSNALISDSLVMQKIAFWGDAVLLGIWGATLSSAVGSLLGAPRILQALAADRVIPEKLSFFERESGKERIPRAGTLFTILIALVSVYFGDLNLLAPILTMFFLTTYGILNITAGIERFLRNPSFRPKFKVHWGFSVVGAIGCAIVMFLINAKATFFAFFFFIIVFIWLKRKGFKSATGDVRKGVLLSIIRFATLRLDNGISAKSWRPNILVFSGAPTKRWHLIDFANALTQRKSLFTVATILQEEKITQEKVNDYESHISEYLGTKNISALVRVMRSSNIYDGAKQLVSAYGLGPLVPNTVLLGDTADRTHYSEYATMIEHIYHSKRNVLIVQDDDHKGFQHIEKMDIWWGGLKGNGALMMILGYLLKSGRSWNGVEICIKMVVPTEEAAESAKQNLCEKLQVMRVDFTTDIIVSGDEDFWSIINRESKKCSLTMLGLASPSDNFEAYYTQLKENTKDISSKVFVLASQEMEFKDILS